MRVWLHDLRQEKGLTLRELGERIGITEGYMSFIEAGSKKKRMDIRTLALIADATGASLYDLMAKELEHEGICNPMRS